jgi:A/G-specific adenine glycosylase
LIQEVNASHFNQAIMETGALICRPRRPLCEQCLLSKDCVAFRTGRTAQLPVVPRAPRLPHHTIAVGVVWKKGKILIARRREEQMLGGLWEFPGGKQRKGEPLARTVVREILEETGLHVRVGDPIVTVKHAYSHFRITLTAFRCAWLAGGARPRAAAALKWISPSRLSAYPFPRANRRIAELVV